MGDRLLRILRMLELAKDYKLPVSLTAGDVAEIYGYVMMLEDALRADAETDTVIYPPQNEHIYTDNGPIQVTYDD
jgi:hypothetical protein